MATKASRQKATQRQIQKLESVISALQSRSETLSTRRLFVFLTTLILTGILHFSGQAAAGWLVLASGATIFTVLALRHQAVARSLRRHRFWLELKTQQLARMRLDWEKLPYKREAPGDPDHPYEVDLDITGPRSLHHLIDISVSHEGSAALAERLLQPNLDPDHIRDLQRITRDLVPLASFRNRLLLAFAEAGKGYLEGGKLLAWLQKDKTPKHFRWLVPLLSLLAAVNIVLFVSAAAGLIGPWWSLSLFIYGAIFLSTWSQAAGPLSESVFLDDQFSKFRAILTFLERYPYPRESALAGLCRPFFESESRPSRALRRISILTMIIGFRDNPVIALALNAVLPYDFYCAKALIATKARLARRMPLWLDSFYSLEAFLSLANHGYLNPENIFPAVFDQAKKTIPLLRASALAHPLIPDETNIANDAELNAPGEIILITGSNMSGKSTFLKTIGLNVSLAYAGAPVHAREMELGLMSLFGCLKISDSVTKGVSFFYAEVRRLKRLLDAVGEQGKRPVLFLIDEIFRGTNNRERLIGSRSFLQALAGKNGLGVVTTHDLELVSLGDRMATIQNMHFREHVENGRMTFDYTLRPGPCPTTNALKIMALEGLPVDVDPSQTPSGGS